MGHRPIIKPDSPSPRRPPPPTIITPLPDFPSPGSIPPMNALEILRETARILRAGPSPFLTTLSLLICPVSAALLSDALVPRSAARSLSRRLALLAVASGLPSTRFLAQLSSHLSGAVLSSAFCFPFLLTFLLLARAAIAYSVACSYAGRKAVSSEFLASVRPNWQRIISTYLWVCAAISSCLALFLFILVLICNALAALGYPPEIVVYPALLILLAFSVAYAHTIIVCNLGMVISVLEDASGPRALLRSVHLIRGQTQAGLLIFLVSAIGMAFVEGLFEHRVKTLSYGDGSSRLWEGPLLVIMYSFVVLVDSMMSAVFYFTCRSSNMEELNSNGYSLEGPEKSFSDSMNTE